MQVHDKKFNISFKYCIITFVLKRFKFEQKQNFDEIIFSILYLKALILACNTGNNFVLIICTA